MNHSSSRNERYNAGYWEWLRFWSFNALLCPLREWKAVLLYFGRILGGILNAVLWLFVVCAFPISFPLASWYVMWSQKREMRNQYGHERLSDG